MSGSSDTPGKKCPRGLLHVQLESVRCMFRNSILVRCKEANTFSGVVCDLLSMEGEFGGDSAVIM